MVGFQHPQKIIRGIKQGCPLSSLLFVITVETMRIKIRPEESLKGIKLSVHHKYPFKISQFADDTTLFLKSKEDVTKAPNKLEIFVSLSGLRLNREKNHMEFNYVKSRIRPMILKESTGTASQ